MAKQIPVYGAYRGQDRVMVIHHHGRRKGTSHAHVMKAQLIKRGSLTDDGKSVTMGSDWEFNRPYISGPFEER